MDAILVFRCEQCGEEFPTRSARLAHRSKPHATAPSPIFTCAACGGAFRAPRELALHAKYFHAS